MLTDERKIVEDCSIEHRKVYADIWLMTLPPQAPWICSRCGETGNEVVHTRINKDTYRELVEKFNRNK